MTFVLTATKVLNILSKTLKDAVSGFFEFYSLREGGGLLKKRELSRTRLLALQDKSLARSPGNVYRKKMTDRTDRKRVATSRSA